jgi:hypothetical protein
MKISVLSVVLAVLSFSFPAFAEPMRYAERDMYKPSYRSGPLPFKFFQFINGLRKMVERDCGSCAFYGFEIATRPEESKHRPFVSVTKVDTEGKQIVGIMISCPALTRVEGILAILFEIDELHGELYYEGAYEAGSISLFKDEKTENMAVDSLLAKLEDFYGWDEKIDTRYNDYLVDFGRPDFEMVRYDFLLEAARLLVEQGCGSVLFYTDILSPGIKADDDIRTVNKAHVMKFASQDGRELLVISCPSAFKINNGNFNFLFEPIPGRKVLKLSKIVKEKGEYDPNDPQLRGAWKTLLEAIKTYQMAN